MNAVGAGLESRVGKRDAVLAAVAALKADVEVVASMSFDALTRSERLAVLGDLETVAWRLPAVGHGLVNELAAENPKELGATSLADVLCTRLRISATEAKTRIRHAQILGPRRALSGQPLAARLPKVAAAQASGSIGPEHVRVIVKFFHELPEALDYQTRDCAEEQLAQLAAGLGPTELRAAADRLAYLLDQDGTFSDADRARKRAVSIGRQGRDGLSKLTGWLTPQARAVIDAVLATWAAPGRCNPEDDTPCVDGQPGERSVGRDRRTQAQRNHDALIAVGRSVLCSGELGRHKGLPATIIVSTTLQELQSGAGQAVTGGGSLLPMADLIRLASHAYHYLVVFDRHTQQPLYLGKSKRLATPAQRIVLHARDRGCTRPGCTAPGYWCDAHHVDGWAAANSPTDVDTLTLACPPDNRLIEETGWTTRTRADGRIEWIPPPDLDTGQAQVNNYHHPQNYLVPDEHNDGDDDGDSPATT